MLDSGGAEEKPFELGNKYLFMVITSASHYLSGAVEALKAKDPHAKIAMVYSDDPFSKAVLARGQAAGQGRRPASGDGRILLAVDHRFRSDRQQDHLVERRRLHGRRPLFRRRHAGAPDARPEGQHEVDLDPGGAGRRQVRRARPVGARRDRAIAMGAPGQLQAAIRPDHGGVRQGVPGQIPRQGRTIMRRPATPAAWSCSTRSSRPARSIRKRSRRRSMQPTSPLSSATSNS